MLEKVGCIKRVEKGSHPDCSPWESITYYLDTKGASITIRNSQNEWYIWFNFKPMNGFSGYEGKRYERRLLIVEKEYYIHQLQNLHFALTGKTLEVNIET